MELQLNWEYDLENKGELLSRVLVIYDRSELIPERLKKIAAPFIVIKKTDGGIFAFWHNGEFNLDLPYNLRIRLETGRPA